MSNFKIYNVLGIMSGTSMDGVDLSLIKTDGMNYTKIVYEKNYKYSNSYKHKLKKLIINLPKTKKNQFIYSKKNEYFVTDSYIKYIKKFLKKIKFNNININIELIGLSGQTIFHNPDKGYSIQLGNGKEVYEEINIPVIVNFRQNDLFHGGQGAPIGTFYHKSILNKIKEKACIINLGGVANITFINNNKLTAFDIGPANALIDDLCFYYYKKDFDKSGSFAKKGKLIAKIFNEFKLNLYFKKNFLNL